MKFLPPIAVAAVLVAAGSAQAQERGWYVRGDVGGSFEGQVKAERNADLDSAVFGAAGVGYDLGNGLRAEGETVFTKNDLDSPSGGDATTIGGFANIVYDFQTPGRIKPFVGAGLGLAHVKPDGAGVDDEDTGLAYQAKAGVSYQINDRLTAEMAYRYMRVNDVKFGAGATGLESDLDSQTVTVGVRYKLGS